MPSITAATQVRTNTDGGRTVNAFKISSQGVVTNASLKDYKQVTLNPLGQWNHLTVVYYTDGTSGSAYYFMNGAYMGYTDLFAADCVDSYIMGVRFNVDNTTQTKNASICYDNISLAAYADYLNGETDGATSKATAEKYVTAAPARKFVSVAKSYAINGIASEKDINAALAEASAKGTSLDLLSNVKGTYTVTTNGIIATNGYDIEFSSDSYGYETLVDVNGNEVYRFSDAFNQEVDVNFYVGADFDNYSDGIYETVSYKYGNVPTFDFINVKMNLSADGRSATASSQIGWVTESGELIGAITLDMIETYKETGIKVYPAFSAEAKTLTSYTKDTATGKVIDVDTTANETKASFAALSGNKTFVFLADTNFTASHSFYTDEPTKIENDVTTVNGVVIDNDYTEEEIAAMREVVQVINVDFNGYAVNANYTRFACVSNNTVMNIYSSAPGGTLTALGVSSNAVKGQRTLAIMHRSGNEGIANAKQVFNAVLNVGSYVDENGNVLYKNNFTAVGGFLVEGNTGDNSCEMNFNDTYIYGAINDSDSVIMTRYYYGEMNFTNTVIASYKQGCILSLRANGSGADACTPNVVFENCRIMTANPASNIINKDGYDSSANTGSKETSIVFNNCQITGRLNPATSGTIRVGEGTAATTHAVSKYVETDLGNYTYNVPMDVSVIEDENVIKVPKPAVSGSNAVIVGYYYFVESAYMATFKAENPDVAAADIVEIGLLTKITAKKTDAVKVTFEDLDGTVAHTDNYVKGGYIIPEVVNTSAGKTNTPVVADGSIVSGALKITADGTWNVPAGPVTEDTVVKTKGYTVSGNISGIKANLSIYSDFGVNVYIPASYAEYVLSVSADGKALLPITGVELNGESFIKTTVTRAAKDATKDAVITFTVKDSYDGVEYEKAVSVTINVATYAAKVLALETATDADKQLMYQMLTYANEAIKFAGGEANTEIAALIGENVVTDYTEGAKDEAKDTAALEGAFAGATVDTGDELAFVFVLKNDFAGTVTVKNGGANYTFEVGADDSRIIEISGMKVYNFAHTLEITAEGTVGGEAVSVKGEYNLATFVQYHIDGALAENEESVACVEFAKAFYNYAKCALAYVTAE